MMNRRRFLTLTTCAAGVFLLPIQSAWPVFRDSAPDGPDDRRSRMLYGKAGRDCARYPGAAMVSESDWPDHQF